MICTVVFRFQKSIFHLKFYKLAIWIVSLMESFNNILIIYLFFLYYKGL